MKKLENGFTLAEILVTLGIVGIIAAVILPRITNHFYDAAVGINLARVVEQIESGCADIIQKANTNAEDNCLTDVVSVIKASDIPNPAGSSDNSIAANIGEIGYTYMDLEEADDDITISASSYNGDFMNSEASDISSHQLYKSKKTPAHVCFVPEELANNDDYDNYIATVYIDANGQDNAPNAFGQDLFVFYLKNNGKMEPFGLDDYTVNCTNDNITDGKSCTARVVADGWTINYK